MTSVQVWMVERTNGNLKKKALSSLALLSIVREQSALIMAKRQKDWTAMERFPPFHNDNNSNNNNSNNNNVFH